MRRHRLHGAPWEAMPVNRIRWATLNRRPAKLTLPQRSCGQRVRSLAPRLPVAAVVRALGGEARAELADLRLVAVEQHRRLHRLPVDVGAVEATDVHNLEFVVLPTELRMPAAHGDIVEKDVAAGMSAR